MMQLIKNELIKLRAQKTYLVLSCLVLAVVILVSFVTSVAWTPLLNLLANGRHFITKSAGYEWVIDFVYENPDLPISNMLRTVFKDPKSDGDLARENADKALQDGYYGSYEDLMAQASFYDFKDQNELPDWIAQSIQANLVELYRWSSVAEGFVSDQYTVSMMTQDYYVLDCLLYTSFAEIPYYASYEYDPETGNTYIAFYKWDEGEYVEGEPVACPVSEVKAYVQALLPQCNTLIRQIEQQAISLEPDAYYEQLIMGQRSSIFNYQTEIEQYRAELDNPENELNEYQIASLNAAIERDEKLIGYCEQIIEAYTYLKENDASPDSQAFSIVKNVLPVFLESDLYGGSGLLEQLIDLDDAPVLLQKAVESANSHREHVKQKALIALEYAYKNDAMIEGMGASGAKGAFVSNLSIAAFMITAVTIVLASMILSREFATGTVRLWVIRPKTRSKLLGSKIATLLLYIAGMMLICFGITYAFALINHVLDLFFYGESTLFVPYYGVIFNQTVAIPAIFEHVWMLIVLTLPIMLFAMLCLLISVLTKKGVLGIVLGMLVLMFASDIQAVVLVVANYTGGFGYLLQATVLPYLSMDALLCSPMDYALSTYTSGSSILELLDLKSLLMGQLWGTMPYECSTIVGVLVLALHIVLLIYASLWAFKRMQIKN
ncbi:MAG: ABC transporter permease subunit [Clostridia bacterium]|nr:ABC transporter permease subunit [Clostridia bacterium]